MRRFAIVTVAATLSTAGVAGGERTTVDTTDFEAGVGRAPAGQVIYQTDFVDPPGDRWSTQQVTDAPADDNPFLGRFTNDPVTLTLTDLPDHQLLRIEFDLHIIRTWDGHHERYGPDYWKLTTDDGRVWVNATFANFTDEYGDARQQSYPTTLPGERVPPFSQVVRRDALGYDRSATYRVRLSLPHAADAVAFTFTGVGLQHVDDESWGIDDLRVSVLSAGDVPAADDEQFQAMIETLRGDKPIAARSAMLRAVEQGDRFTDFLAERMDGGLIVTDHAERRRRLDRWIGQLDSDNYDQREAAMAELAGRILIARPRVEAALRRPDVSAEMRWRLEQLRDAEPTGPIEDPSLRLEQRLRRTLALIGTDAAAALLERID